MTFKEIEQIIGFKIPNSNYVYPAIWANSDSHPIAKAWLNAGYLSEQLNLVEETIVFRKNDGKSSISLPVKKVVSVTNATERKIKCSMPVEKAICLIKEYYQETVIDPNGRYMSWRHCYNVFSENRETTDEKTIDYLALHLA